jgi:hypothetical protein
MPVTINVNNLTLCHKGSNGISTATIPDVCKTPSPGGPVPVPYPNIAMSMDMMKGTTTVKADGGMMCANYGSEFFKSTGDEPGVAGGVVSSTFIKEATWITFSFDVKLQGKAACRLTDKMFHNHQNTVNMAGEIQVGLMVEMAPPGDCTPEQHRKLQDDVNNKCKSEKRSCKGVRDCATLLENTRKNWDCAVARELVAKMCFRGGDDGHRQAILDALNAAAYCESQFNTICKPQPVPVPVPVPVPENDLMKRMAEITGLTGTALIVYVVISEGSRLFPPRNLIPVP